MDEKGRDPSERFMAELDGLLGGGPPPEPPPTPSSASAPPSSAAPAGPPPPATVLVVEDNKDYRDIVKFVLSEQGYKVLEAKNGLEGLRLARSRRPDLVLLDFEMPELNGYEVVRDLRSREDTIRLPIIMITGAKNRRYLREEVRMDISDFLEKPVANPDLVAAVSRALRDRPLPPPEAAAPAEAAPIELEAPAPAAEAPPEVEATPVEEPEEDLGVEEDFLIEEERKDEDQELGLDMLSKDSPIVGRINRILVKAVEMGASDIHIEPQGRQIVVRTRLNGALKQLCRLPGAMSAQIAARVKIMSNLVITERRKPQDGQFRATIRSRKIEFRVSSLPSIHGEKIVLRVLGGVKLKGSLGELGASARDLEAMEGALRSPHGLILVTGPTGSGKTTTLYTMIGVLNTPDVNIMTAEDPVEYEIGGITQVHVKPLIGLTFEAVLRSFLRQDPDIMLVGEIRDLETADIAVKASITGHLVLSTLHTNSAPATITRLTNMGLPAHLVADSVRIIIAQRLIRTLCPGCRVEAPLSDDAKRWLTPEEAARLPRVWSSKGCAQCHDTGTIGRTPIFETMPIRTPEMRSTVLTARSADAILAQALQEGLIPLRQEALRAVGEGRASLEEAFKIVMAE
ncbi:MAG: Flp pilus assembly complex ATPase component TadA [Elusimicrobia bacterium]|nr:Flp pilus assembly complex ATPase component TadA [Elusimicrobiota bacterium]